MPSPHAPCKLPAPCCQDTPHLPQGASSCASLRAAWFFSPVPWPAQPEKGRACKCIAAGPACHSPSAPHRSRGPLQIPGAESFLGCFGRLTRSIPAVKKMARNTGEEGEGAEE